MGCFGVGILVKQNLQENILFKKHFSLDKYIESNLNFKREFRCKSCENNEIIINSSFANST